MSLTISTEIITELNFWFEMYVAYILKCQIKYKYPIKYNSIENPPTN